MGTVPTTGPRKHLTEYPIKQRIAGLFLINVSHCVCNYFEVFSIQARELHVVAGIEDRRGVNTRP